MTKVQTVKRLLALYNVLCDVAEAPGKNLDMSAWVREKRTGSVYAGEAAICKTAACVAGWATLAVRELVLRHGRPFNTANGQHDYDAFASAFGLDYGEAWALCQPGASHKTANQAKRAVLALAKQYAADTDLEIVDR